MQFLSRLTLPLLACALLGGCAGVSPTRIIGNAAGVAGGALIGNALGKGNPLATTLGAGAGVLPSETLQAGSNLAQQKSYLSGYEKGQSDTAKRQFQALNEKQRLTPEAEDAAHVCLLELPLPERQVNGATLAPLTATLRIQE